MEEKSKVYALKDEQNRIISIEGGYSIDNIIDISEWIYIDEGEGDKYNLCQTCYLPKSIRDDGGICRYKYENGEIVERTQAEIDADYAEIAFIPSQLDRIEAQIMFTALMTDTLLEEEEI